MSTLWEDLYHDLQQDEGAKYEVYDDPVKPGEGLYTGGRGHLLTDAEKKAMPLGTKLPSEQVEDWYQADIVASVKAARRAIPDFDTRPRDFQRATVNHPFQLGANSPTEKFPKAFAFLKDGHIEDAIAEFGLNDAGDGPSDWSTQTPTRFAATMDKFRSSMQGPSAASEPGLMAPVEEPQVDPKSNIPESWLERRGDEVEMLGKGLASGMPIRSTSPSPNGFRMTYTGRYSSVLRMEGGSSTCPRSGLLRTSPLSPSAPVASLPLAARWRPRWALSCCRKCSKRAHD